MQWKGNCFRETSSIGEQAATTVVQRTLCLSYEKEDTFWSGEKLEKMHGVLQSYICCDCGYTQMFTQGINFIKDKLYKVSEGNDTTDPYR